MAPRRQAKQPAAETVVAAANGNATPPKKRKIAAKPVTEKPKPVRTMAPRAAKEKQNDNNNYVAADEIALPPKKSRGKTKTAVEAPKSPAAAKSKAKRVNKQAEVAVDSNTDEEIAEQEKKQVVEKKARGKPAAKKAGTLKKPAAAKSRAKKPQDEAIENGAEDLEKDIGEKNSTKRTRRGGKAVEDMGKNDAPAASKAKPAAKSRKRKPAEDVSDVVAEAEVAEKDEETEMVADKKFRGKSKKVETETSDAPKVKSGGKATKNSAKLETAKPLSKEVEVKEQSDQSVELDDDSKEKNAKNTKRGNAKKVTSRSKRNAAEKIDDTSVEEAAPIETPEDVKENGDGETVHKTESKQTKKKNAGKTNTVTNEKTETKGRQKKGQTVTADEIETVKDEITELINLKASENHVNDVTFSKQNDGSQENGEENVDKNNTSKVDSVEDEDIDKTYSQYSQAEDVDTSFLSYNL